MSTISGPQVRFTHTCCLSPLRRQMKFSQTRSFGFGQCHWELIHIPGTPNDHEQLFQFSWTYYTYCPFSGFPQCSIHVKELLINPKIGDRSGYFLAKCVSQRFAAHRIACTKTMRVVREIIPCLLLEFPLLSLSLDSCH